MIRLLIKLYCCSIVLAVTPLHAAESDALFRVSVPVASQSAAERARAASLGLRKVLIRMSGSAEVVDAAAVRQAYMSAQNYIEQFRYENYDPEQRLEDDGGASELLVMTFSRSVVEQLLREADQPYWPPNRPPVFVWLVEDTASDGKVLVNDRESEVIKGLLESGRERGLKIQLPLLDLEDRLALPAEKLWQLDEQTILNASERYEVDTVLVGRYSRTSRGRLLSTWQFLHRGAVREYDFRADSALELGTQALDPLADYLAGLYAISPREEGTPQLVMNLSGISGFTHYRAALDYLRGLAIVTDVQLQAVRDDTLLLSVTSDGDVNMLRNTLSLDRQLAPVNEEQTADTPPWLQVQEGTPENPVNYQWQGR